VKIGNKVTSVVASKDSKFYFLSVNYDTDPTSKYITQYDARTNKLLKIYKSDHREDITLMVITKDNKFLFSVDNDFSLVKWKLQRTEPQTSDKERSSTNNLKLSKLGFFKKIHHDFVNCIKMSACNQYLYTCSDDTNINQISILDPKKKRVYENAHRSEIKCLAVSYDSKYLFSSGSDEVLKQWRIKSLKNSKSISADEDQFLELTEEIKNNNKAKVGIIYTMAIGKIFYFLKT
jgi:WD40 repeat protein